jgi:hypothetical protein
MVDPRRRPMATTMNMLVDILDLKRIEENIFRGRSPDEDLQRVFGGQARQPLPARLLGETAVAADGPTPSWASATGASPDAAALGGLSPRSAAPS